MTAKYYPKKLKTGSFYLTETAAQQWRADGLGYEDIAVKTGRAPKYVKAKLIKWGLWA
jgi:hypothetical protein